MSMRCRVSRKPAVSIGFSYVGTLHIPLHGGHAQSLDALNHMVVILPVRTAEESRAHTGNGFDPFVAGCDISDDLIPGKSREVGVAG